MDLQELSQTDMMLMAAASKDEVDFVKPPMQNHYQQQQHYNNNTFTNTNTNSNTQYVKVNTEIQVPKINATKVPKEHHHQRLSTLFSFAKKSKSHEDKEKEKAAKPDTYMTTTSGFPCQPTPVPIGTPPRQKKFVKSSSIARLLGNTYNAKKYEKEENKLASDKKFNTFGGRRRSSGASLERFKRYAKEEGDNVTASDKSPLTSSTPVIPVIGQKKDKSKGDTLDRHLLALEHFQESHNGDFGSKAMRTISRGLGKLWWRRTHSIDISSPDPEFKVSYLGNVLTGWAKGKNRFLLFLLFFKLH